MYAVDYSNYLQHHGILGMRWGVRRYQNADGSLTSAGKRRYNENYNPDQIRRDIAVYGKRGAKRISKDMDRGIPISGARSLEARRYHKAEEASNTGRKVGKVVGIVGGIALGALGIYAATQTKKGRLACYKIINKLTPKVDTGKFAGNIEGYISAQSARSTKVDNTFYNVQNFLKSPYGKAAVISGSSVVASLLGAAIGKNAPLAAKGYTSLARHDMKVGYTEKTTRSDRDKKADKVMQKMGY